MSMLIYTDLIFPRDLYEFTRSLTEKIADAAENSNIKAIIQLHGGCYPHNATAAYPLVKELNPDYIGIKIDPGNNYNQEGYEDFEYQVNLLNEYIGALGAKDACSCGQPNPNKAIKDGKHFLCLLSKDKAITSKYLLN
mgnify:CR=1 FL=1